MSSPGHIPVLLDTVLEHLAPAPGDTVVDCTLGRGGHAEAIAPRLAPGGRYIGLDLDPANLAFARDRLADAPVPVDCVHRNFADAAGVLDELGAAGADGVLADLGFASVHVDDPERGFSFKQDGPLDMRLDPTVGATAAELVNTLSERDLADMIYRYGEERLSRRIARKIVEARRNGPIHNTGQLAELCARAYPPPRRSGSRGRGGRGGPRIDPATRTFQALRIAVNDELGSLQTLLDTLPGLARPGARVVIISFHSLEDRMVKHASRAWAADGLGRVLTKKPAVADDQEMADNPRSRSAKLRAFAFHAAPAEHGLDAPG